MAETDLATIDRPRQAETLETRLKREAAERRKKAMRPTKHSEVDNIRSEISRTQADDRQRLVKEARYAGMNDRASDIFVSQGLRQIISDGIRDAAERVEVERKEATETAPVEDSAESDETPSEAADRMFRASMSRYRIINIYDGKGDTNQLVENAPVTVRKIIRVVGAYYGVSAREIVSQRRTKRIVTPRQVAMYLAKSLTLRSYPHIGTVFGDRDHTTILYGVRKIEHRMSVEPKLADEIADLLSVLDRS